MHALCMDYPVQGVSILSVGIVKSCNKVSIHACTVKLMFTVVTLYMAGLTRVYTVLRQRLLAH